MLNINDRLIKLHNNNNNKQGKDMNKKIIVTLLSMFFSINTHADKLDMDTNQQEKSSFEHSAYANISENLSIGCIATQSNDEDIEKKTAIKIISPKHIDLPGSPVQAVIILGKNDKHTVDGILTKSTEAEFYYSIESGESKNVRKAINAIMGAEDADISLYSQEGHLLLKEINKTNTNNKDVTIVIDSCVN